VTSFGVNSSVKLGSAREADAGRGDMQGDFPQ
jgi:hypothetical protein